MPGFTLQVGEFVSFPFIVKAVDGSPDTSAVATAGAGNPANLRVRINPSNPREVGVLALSQTTGINAIVTANGHSSSTLFVVPPPPDLSGVTIGTIGTPTTVVPDWML